MGYTVAEFCSGVFSYLSVSPSTFFSLIPPSPFFLSLEVSPSGEHPNDFTAQHDSLTHASSAEVFYFSVSLLYFFFL